jgi:prepilin-type N-terminal cleavage/methylation domain-containing protein
MRKSTSGFTIVELLIVVVVIGILAAIVIVAYNGITTQAKNTKTISAVNTWVKALRLYEVDKGSMPSQNSCLGNTSTYPGGYCYDGTGWDIDTGFLNAMDDYISGFPEPDVSQVNAADYPQRRGALHYRNGSGVHYIYMMLLGTNDCPSLSSGTYSTRVIHSNNVECRYTLN